MSSSSDFQFRNFLSRSFPLLLIPLLSAIVTACGCGRVDDRPATVTVKGTVIYREKPVVGARVEFMNDSASRAATGITNEQGAFTLTTFEQDDGAVPGLHKVSVVIPGSDLAKAVSGVEGEEYEKAMAQLTSSTPDTQYDAGGIPSKYTDRRTSGLEYEVKQGEKNDFDIVLKD